MTASIEGIQAPVEIVVIAFPGSRFTGEIVPALAELVDAGIIRILDLVFVTKAADGAVAGVELSEVSDEKLAAAFSSLDGEVAGLLSEDDLLAAADSLEAGSSAVLIVWEAAWARRLADAVSSAGGRLVAHDRLDDATVAAALADVAE